VALACGLVAALTPASLLADAGRSIPEKFRKAPYTKMSLSIGSPNAGSQVRAKRLKKAPHLSILEKSKDEAYGHPALVLMLKRSAKQMAKSYPGSQLVVGDLSAKNGGPIPGHHSHQSGRDADVLFYARDARGKIVTLDKFVSFGADGKATDGSGLVFDDERNWMLIDTWVRDHRAGLAYVFVSRGLKQRLLAWAGKHPKHKKLVQRASELFVQPDNAEPHDDHFHVRIKCPKDQEGLCKP
jgi:penicillin-insensitive murein endopeptidase